MFGQADGKKKRADDIEFSPDNVPDKEKCKLWIAQSDELVLSYKGKKAPKPVHGFDEWTAVAESDAMIDDKLYDACKAVKDRAREVGKEHQYLEKYNKRDARAEFQSEMENKLKELIK